MITIIVNDIIQSRELSWSVPSLDQNGMQISVADLKQKCLHDWDDLDADQYDLVFISDHHILQHNQDVLHVKPSLSNCQKVVYLFYTEIPLSSPFHQKLVLDDISMKAAMEWLNNADDIHLHPSTSQLIVALQSKFSHSQFYQKAIL